MKKIILFFVLQCILNNYYSQSTFIYKSTETLNSEKAEAIKAAEYSKAAEIKKELDLRESEQKKIAELQIELKNKISTEDYAGAATIKDELTKLQDTKNKKEDLRNKIALAIKEEDYTKVVALKTELLSLYEVKTEGSSSQVNSTENLTDQATTNNIQVNNPAYSQFDARNNQNKTNTNNEKKTVEKKQVEFANYIIGTYTGFGIGLGSIKQKGIGSYVNFRCSPNLFKSSSSSHYIQYGEITGTYPSEIYEYKGKSYYSRWEFNVGLTSKLFGNVNSVSGALIYGIGYTNTRYLYDYYKGTASSPHSSTELIKNKDLSSGNFNFDWAFMIDFKGVFNIQIGSVICIPNIARESMWTIGVGF